MKVLLFLEPAELELLDAAEWYESQVPGLGSQFLDRIEYALDEITERPEASPVVRHHIRRRLLARFPYCILYRISPHEIIVVAVMHLRRHPAYWIGRI
jgi:plasmid stabilization system protein ParE